MNNIKEISPLKDNFLQRLVNIDNPVNRLWYIGNIPTGSPTVAIVGSRHPSAYGREVNYTITKELAKLGITIISGLAIGHDAIAHQACLDSGGTTIAVIGNGLADIYPKRNFELAQNIVKSGGAVISEYPPHTPVYPNHFLERNRIISALADIVVVIEAGERSGTLNTVSHALAQGKDVMAIPGNITSPLSIGCNRLIAQGATPVLSARDITEALGIYEPPAKTKKKKNGKDSNQLQLV